MLNEQKEDEICIKRTNQHHLVRLYTCGHCMNDFQSLHFQIVQSYLTAIPKIVLSNSHFIETIPLHLARKS